MTALITFAQDFQHFHLVRGDRFAPLTPNPAIARGIDRWGPVWLTEQKA